MSERKGRIGVGELLFGLVIVLGIIGTISFFAFEEYLGEHQTTFMIVSSLAFIVSFFALSVYARAKKRKFVGRLKVDRALAYWIQYISGTGQKRGEKPALPVGTLESIALHIYTTNGYRAADSSAGQPNGILRLINQEGKIEIIYCRQEPQPVGLREVVSFYEVLHAEKAAWGEIWAAGGFAPEVSHWVRKKHITLVDADAIHSIVEDLIGQQQRKSPITQR